MTVALLLDEDPATLTRVLVTLRQRGARLLGPTLTAAPDQRGYRFTITVELDHLGLNRLVRYLNRIVSVAEAFVPACADVSTGYLPTPAVKPAMS